MHDLTRMHKKLIASPLMFPCIVRQDYHCRYLLLLPIGAGYIIPVRRNLIAYSFTLKRMLL
jgi:hypothetical protein